MRWFLLFKLMIYKSYLDSPLGKLLICGNEKEICLLSFFDDFKNKKEIEFIQKRINYYIHNKDLELFNKVQNELNQYFRGERKSFNVPLKFIGTDFQKNVWQTLMTIPYGNVMTYKKQAEKLGNINKVRAVANANSKNRIVIIVPCHRVIGSNKELTGYSGEIWRKKELLKFEGYMDFVSNKLVDV